MKIGFNKILSDNTTFSISEDSFQILLISFQIPLWIQVGLYLLALFYRGA